MVSDFKTVQYLCIKQQQLFKNLYIFIQSFRQYIWSYFSKCCLSSMDEKNPTIDSSLLKPYPLVGQSCCAVKHYSNPQNFILNSSGDTKYVRLNFGEKCMKLCTKHLQCFHLTEWYTTVWGYEYFAQCKHQIKLKPIDRQHEWYCQTMRNKMILTTLKEKLC